MIPTTKKRKTFEDVALECAEIRHALSRIVAVYGATVVMMTEPERLPNRDAQRVSFSVEIPSFNPAGS